MDRIAPTPRFRPWRILVVEDDPYVARIHCRFIAEGAGCHVAGIARTGAQARHMLVDLKPDLLLLDFGIPDGDGLELLRQIRGSGFCVEVIAITAASSLETIRQTMQLGVVDYLVKPFDLERLRRALSQFKQRMAVFQSELADQAAVDAIRATGVPPRRAVPKDLSEVRMATVRDRLNERPEPTTADEIGVAIGVSRVTARRYLEYLVTLGEVVCTQLVTGPGRPRHVYQSLRSPQVYDGAQSMTEDDRYCH